MFTVKLYSHSGYRQVILEAESFTILHNQDGTREVTLHRPLGPSGEYNDVRHDIGPEQERDCIQPSLWARAIIENAAGRTTEMVNYDAIIRSVPKAA
jgi:hypothetical protein